MNEIRDIFSYPNYLSDINVWCEENEESTTYHIGVEELICYRTLEEGIDYIKGLKEIYYEWLKGNSYIQDVENRNKSLNTLSNIKINKESCGYTIKLNAPSFSELFDTYVWLDGVVKQLESIKEEDINENY